MDKVNRLFPRPNIKQLIERVDLSTPVTTGSWFKVGEDGKMIAIDPGTQPPNIFVHNYLDEVSQFQAMLAKYKAGREVSVTMFDTETGVDPETWMKKVREAVDSGCDMIEIDSLSMIKEK